MLTPIMLTLSLIPMLIPISIHIILPKKRSNRKHSFRLPLRNNLDRLAIHKREKTGHEAIRGRFAIPLAQQDPRKFRFVNAWGFAGAFAELL